MFLKIAGARSAEQSGISVFAAITRHDLMKLKEHKNKREASEGEEKTPQLIDLHLHAGWTDFDHAVQEKRSESEQKKRIEVFLREYRRQGIVLARDAGGLSENVEEKDSTRVLAGCGMLGADDSQNDTGLIENAAVKPYSWVKIFVTGGVGMSRDDVLVPTCSRERFFRLVKYFHEHDKRIMVHCYGGAALDWCIEAGVETIEHAVYMTKEQAEKIAEKNNELRSKNKNETYPGIRRKREIAVVPTTSIYRLLSEKPELFGIPDFIRENAKRAAYAQIKSVKYALDAGICIGYGTDFYADPALIPYAGYELSTLSDCGLSTEQALAAGTVNAEAILS